MFQFHFGSIGSTSPASPKNLMRCFNSTLVRLEVLSWRNPFIVTYVSIPLWFDWKFQGSYYSIIRLPFQFHFGSIGSQGSDLETYLSCVSIPLWFDWKLLKKDGYVYLSSFNSTLVRLEARSNTCYDADGMFQFHFGSIGSYTAPFRTTWNSVSIPLWFDWKKIFELTGYVS